MKIYFTKQAYRQLLLEVKKHTRVETGAILIGRIINGSYYVFESLDSGINCRRSSVIFYRDNPYSEHLADVVRAKYQKAYAIGFWHRHPGDFDRFSYDDKEANLDMARVLKRSVISGLVTIYNGKIKLSFWEITLNNEYTKAEIIVDDECFDGILMYKEIDAIEDQILENEGCKKWSVDSSQPIADSSQKEADSSQPIADSSQKGADSSQQLDNSSQPVADSGHNKEDSLQQKEERHGFLYTIRKLFFGSGDKQQRDEKPVTVIVRDATEDEKTENQAKNALESKQKDEKQAEVSVKQENPNAKEAKKEEIIKEKSVADDILDKIKRDIADFKSMDITCQRYTVNESLSDKLFLSFTKGEKSCDVCFYLKNNRLVYFINEELDYSMMGFTSSILKELVG